jgi:hypothetical protein
MKSKLMNHRLYYELLRNEFVDCEDFVVSVDVVEDVVDDVDDDDDVGSDDGDVVDIKNMQENWFVESDSEKDRRYLLVWC